MLNIFKNDKLSTRDSVNLLILVMIFGGVFGFIYEEIFYFIDLGYLVKRGSTFGPWIPVYAFGGLFITLIAYRFRKKPLLTFFLCLVITGTLEFMTGFILYKVFNLRLWDYNVEILNFGNIGGFICLRSVSLFTISGMLLIYVIIPVFIKLIRKVNEKVMCFICYSLISLFIIDIISYMIIK